MYSYYSIVKQALYNEKSNKDFLPAKNVMKTFH